MFSPEATVLSARSSLRNPRRRQRKDSEAAPQQPRRKRSKISEGSFEVPGDARINGNGSVVMNGHVDHSEVEDSLVIVDIPARNKKTSPKRGVRDDAAIYLTKSESYSVRKLPSFPTRLFNTSTPFRAFALPSAGLALALTSTHALAWDYASGGGTARVITLPLPFQPKPSDPLPLGAIVRNGPTNDFGILAIAPSTGKVFFWDNVDTAEVRSHFPQRHQGVDGVVGNMYSGEVITGLVDVEHAGYVLIFSSGRLAQLTLRDPQGRPHIATRYLQVPTSSSGSFFGSFKGLLGSGIRKSIASVKARPSESRGQMEVITASRNGLFHLWDLSWSGQYVFKREIDVHGEVLAALQGITPLDAHGQHEVHILDFAILPEHKVQGFIGLLVLVALSGRDSLDYSLLEVDLSNNAGFVTRAIPIKNFTQTQIPKDPTGTLLLPHPSHTAFIQFPGAIVVASLAEPEQSPEAQLLQDTGKPSLPFQDTIYFREDRQVHFCGHAIESAGKKDKQSSAIIFVQHYGIIQVNASPLLSGEGDSQRQKVTARSKMEQTTFFSTTPENIIDFNIKSRYSFGQEEVEVAAREVSAGILSSSYEFVEKVTSSMDEQIRKRCLALRTLITHLRSEYPPISFKTKFELLWDAERLAAALQLWNNYEERLRDWETDPDAQTPLLIDLIQILHERYKTEIRPELGETDPVRQYFLKDVGRIEVIIPWAWQTLRTFYMRRESKDGPAIMRRVSNASDIILAALETGFEFRQNNAELYGLDLSLFEDGLLRPGHGYDLLDGFWTSTYNLVSSVRGLVDVGRQLAVKNFESGIEEELAKKLAKDNPRLVRICCHIHIERFRWNLEQSDEKRRESGRKLREEFILKVRPEQIYNLLELGMATEGMNLAEGYGDMTTLARLVWEETKYLEESKRATQSKMEEAECAVKLNRIKDRVSKYFSAYGDVWAKAFYDKFIMEHQSGQLFLKEHLNQPALTKYLRAEPSRARLRWINEVSGEKDYEAAGRTLLTLAAKQESNVWCKKVELSLAKLALLSKKRSELQDEEAGDDILMETARKLECTNIQNRVYERIAPIISEALDDESAVQLLMTEFGQDRLEHRPAHQQLLQQGFESLVRHRVMDPTLLIDVLTFVTLKRSEPADRVQANEFAFALKALALSWNDMDGTLRKSTLRLIWKRLLIQDNWEKINNTAGTSDELLEEKLASTTAFWTWRALIKMINDNDAYNVVRPKALDELLGAGCTDAELSPRFGSQDLRGPIISDNVADDQILRANVEKYRLKEWVSATEQAAKKAVAREMNGEAEESVVESDGSAESVKSDEEGEVSASEAFEGDDEESAVGQDVEMEDA